MVLASCTKEPLPELPEPSAPIYGLKGLIDGEAFDVNVGVGDAEITYGISEINGIGTYFGQIDAPSQDFTLRLEVFKPERVVADVSEGQMIQDDPDFFVHTPACVRLDFGPKYPQHDYLLIENDNGQFEPASYVSYNEFGLYEMTMKFTDYSPQPFTIPIRYGFEYQEMDPEYTSEAVGDTVTFTGAGTFAESEWYVNDHLESTEQNYKVRLQDGIHEIVHLVRDTDGNEASYTSLVRMKHGNYMWQLKYNYCTEIDQNNYGEMMVSMKKDGMWYHSSRGISNFSKKFDLGTIQYYSTDDQGPRLAYFDIAFDANLKDDRQSLSLSLENISGTIAVGLK